MQSIRIECRNTWNATISSNSRFNRVERTCVDIRTTDGIHYSSFFPRKHVLADYSVSGMMLREVEMKCTVCVPKGLGNWNRGSDM